MNRVRIYCVPLPGTECVASDMCVRPPQCWLVLVAAAWKVWPSNRLGGSSIEQHWALLMLRRWSPEGRISRSVNKFLRRRPGLVKYQLRYAGPQIFAGTALILMFVLRPYAAPAGSWKVAL